jgi:hypothetical protein
MFVAELMTLGGILGIPIMAAAIEDYTVLPMLWTLCVLAFPTLLVIDAFDPGEVNLLPPRRLAAFQPQPAERPRVTGIQLAFSF